jgi:hypothetical protein
MHAQRSAEGGERKQKRIGSAESKVQSTEKVGWQHSNKKERDGKHLAKGNEEKKKRIVGKRSGAP